MRSVIVAIGGGEIGRPGTKIETLSIDKFIVKQTKKAHPKLLFIPTASGDSEGYCKVIENYFGKRLGCKIKHLLLLKKTYLKKELRKLIMESDIIYVGGGNTLKLMRRLRFLGVDSLIKEKYKKGVVLCGVSAGANCWFSYSHSDSMKLYGHSPWEYIKVNGFGFIQATCCPHFDTGDKRHPRKKDFMEFMSKHSGIGIGIDEKCALVVSGGNYKIITSSSQAHAYLISKQSGKITSTVIRKSDYQPLDLIYPKV